MDFSDQWAGCIKYLEFSIIRFLPNCLRHTMSAKNTDHIIRNFVDLFDASKRSTKFLMM